MWTSLRRSRRYNVNRRRYIILNSERDIPLPVGQVAGHSFLSEESSSPTRDCCYLNPAPRRFTSYKGGCDFRLSGDV